MVNEQKRAHNPRDSERRRRDGVGVTERERGGEREKRRDGVRETEERKIEGASGESRDT